uniref:PspA/IM30 family protein n=1 Tax=Araucaria cunninghamii TaxID=56994 RepID=A0A0D6R1I9_ARACU
MLGTSTNMSMHTSGRTGMVCASSCQPCRRLEGVASFSQHTQHVAVKVSSSGGGMVINGKRFSMSISRRRSVRLSSSFPHGYKTTFFNGGVELLETAGLQHGLTKGGGALGAQMNIFGRVARLIKSYVNALISSVEDPEKLLDQTVEEMNTDLTKMRQASAQVLASQKQLENKYKTAKQSADAWYRRAKLALEKGDENLAREALVRRKSLEDNANALKSQLEQQKNVVEKLISSTQLLESKIQEAKSKKDTLKARAQSAKTAQKVNEMLGTVNTSSALAVFEKMEQKVMALEAEADALNQMNTDDLEGKFALLESSSVDEDLTSLRREISGTSRRDELPAGRSPVSSARPAYPFRDLEIENELNELRRKTKEF